MNLDDYQKKAIATAIYPKDKRLMGLMYCSLKLNGEAGEVAEKVGKLMRDDNFKLSQEKREAILYELGDVLWYLANLANELEHCQHSRRHEFGEVEKTQSHKQPQGQWRQAMKLDQLAFYCVGNDAALHVKKLWACRTPDGPTTRSPVR